MFEMRKIQLEKYMQYNLREKSTLRLEFLMDTAPQQQSVGWYCKEIIDDLSIYPDVIDVYPDTNWFSDIWMKGMINGILSVFSRMVLFRVQLSRSKEVLKVRKVLFLLCTTKGVDKEILLWSL